MSHKFILITFLCISVLAPIIYGHKILVIVPVYGKNQKIKNKIDIIILMNILTLGQSHWNYMKVFIESLLNRGNEITCITSITMGENKPQNYTEILMDPPYYRTNLSKLFLI